MEQSHNFGPGFGHSSRFSRRRRIPSRLLKLKSRKSKKLLVTESEKNMLLSSLAREYNIPSDVEHELISSSRIKLDSKLKRDIILFSRLKKVHETYPDLLKLRVSRPSIQLFYALNHKYRESFVKALERDIEFPHKDMFPWLKLNWKQVIEYIGNRKIPQSEGVKHFIHYSYGNDIPKKVNFRKIVNIVNEYISDHDYDYDI